MIREVVSMRTMRVAIWGSAIVAIGVLLLLDLAGAYPDWLIIGPVCLGVAGVALLIDQIVWDPTRKFGYIISLLMIALSAGTVAQDAELVIDNWAVWPFVVGALVIGLPLETFASHHRHIGPSARAHV
jgi:hypothetical protein